MRNKTSIAALLLLSAALLTGCNLSYGNDRKAIQVVAEEPEQGAGRQDITPQTAPAQLQEDLRLANERAELAEERAELERQKREFAEERLRRVEQSDEGENLEEPAEDKEMGGS